MEADEKKRGKRRRKGECLMAFLIQMLPPRWLKTGCFVLLLWFCYLCCWLRWEGVHCGWRIGISFAFVFSLRCSAGVWKIGLLALALCTVLHVGRRGAGRAASYTII